MSLPGKPTVSVLIVTGSRRESAAATVRSVLANRDPRFDVWLVDTNPDGEVPGTLRPFLSDSRLHYLRTESRGSSEVHNEVIARVTSDLVAVTDDDCRVAENWVEEMIRAFDRDPRIGMVFGNVHPADDIPEGHTVPAYVRTDEFLAKSLRDKSRVEGVWACMGVRRETWAELGGFDERFGRGSRFPGCADSDLAIRALAAGWFVFETPRVSVTIHRALPAEQSRRAVETYTYASGALIGKHLRRRTPGTLGLVAGFAARWAGGGSHPAVGLKGRPQRARRLFTFLRGFVRGATAGVGPL